MSTARAKSDNCNVMRLLRMTGAVALVLVSCFSPGCATSPTGAQPHQLNSERPSRERELPLPETKPKPLPDTPVEELPIEPLRTA